jgi:hypothetical protein
MNKALTTAIWILTVISAYWMGLEHDSAQSNNSVVASLDENLEESTLPQKNNFVLPNKGSTARPMEIPFEAAISEIEKGISEEVIEPLKNRSLANKLESSHPLERLEAFVELLKEPNAGAIQTALQAYESLPGGPGRFSELKILAFAWGKVDPEAALTWSQQQEHWDKHVASGSIMDSWSREDADAAITWAKENFEGEENPYFIGIINGLSESSLPRATDLMTELPYGRVRGRSAHILFEKVWSQGEDVALHWAEHLPEGSLQEFAYGELGEKVARSNISRAVEWVDSMEDSSIKSAVSEDVSREMARQNPSDAGEWVLQMPEGDSRKVAMQEVAKVWSRKDPTATAEWINQFPKGSDADPAIEALVRQIRKSDPQGALNWAASLSNLEQREKLLAETEAVIKAQKFPSGRSSK